MNVAATEMEVVAAEMSDGDCGRASVRLRDGKPSEARATDEVDGETGVVAKSVRCV